MARGADPGSSSSRSLTADLQAAAAAALTGFSNYTPNFREVKTWFEGCIFLAAQWRLTKVWRGPAGRKVALVARAGSGGEPPPGGENTLALRQRFVLSKLRIKTIPFDFLNY